MPSRLTFLTMLMCASFAVADELSVDEFQKLHAEIVPTNETWKSIPWHTNLISAQQAAVEQRKPIFIWAMDGHPLGCT